MADPVKSEPIVVTRGRSPWPKVAVLLALLGLLWNRPASAQSILLGPAARRVKATIDLDPRLPSGPIRYAKRSLVVPKERACSFEVPVCVAFTPETEHRAPDALRALEHAYRRLVYATSLPQPLEWPQPLLLSLEPGRADLVTEELPDLGAPFEQSGLVCRSGAIADTLSHNAWLCVGEAIAARLDAAESPPFRRAFAKALVWPIATPIEYPAEADMVELVQANERPCRGLATSSYAEQSSSAALFFSYLERTLGTVAPFSLLTGLYALSAQQRQPNSPRVLNEPDWLDVLRSSLDDSNVELAHRINAFAAARAQFHTGQGTLSELSWLGSMARLRPDWVLKASSLPRRVASRSPVEPLGVIAVRVDLDVPTKDLMLGMRVEWEGPVPFAWTVVKLDEEEREIGRLDFAFEPRVTLAEKHLTALEATRSLLILGTNLGGVDATHLLDPDHSPFEPHGCTVYVAKL